MEPGLDTLEEYQREASTFPNGAHVCEVEVDPDTGGVALVRYTIVDDFGVLINPMITAGQVHGGLAQGIGQALMERIRYDADSGQMLTASFMDYAVPRADEMPDVDLTFNEVPCTTNPLGVKGCGEAGAVGAFPAVTNAVIDALKPYGVTRFEGPGHAADGVAGDAGVTTRKSDLMGSVQRYGCDASDRVKCLSRTSRRAVFFDGVLRGKSSNS